MIQPLLVSLLMGVHGARGSTVESIRKIITQMLLTFIAGHIVRRWIGDWVNHNKGRLKDADQGSSLLVAYTAFSATVIGGLRTQIQALSLLGVVVGCCLLVALALLVTHLPSNWQGFNLEDRITILFCGSN